MPTDAIQNDYNNSFYTSDRKPKNQLGKNEFLKILVAQLRNQDPLNPLEDKDFIAQMAQFSMLEQIQNMNSELSSMKGIGFIGKIIYAERISDETGEVLPIIGRVSSVLFSGGKFSLIVDGQEVTIDEVLQVFSDIQLQDVEKLL